MENAVTMSLGHFGMNIVTTVTELGDFLGQKFDTLSRIAENDTLINLKEIEKNKLVKFRNQRNLHF